MARPGPYPASVGIEFQSETRIMIGQLAAPTDPSRSWWWQSTTTLEGVETTIGGFTATENDAILEAARSTISLRSQARPARAKREPDPRYHEPGWWPGLDDKEP
jgi:hypothetical protein